MDRRPDNRRYSNRLHLSVPPRPHLSFSRLYPSFSPSSAAAPSSPFAFSPSYSSSTPSKLRRPPSSSFSSASSFSSLFLLLLSLRSLYSLLPFIRSTPSSSVFPFSFLVSFLSFIVYLPFSFSLRQSLSLSPSLIRPLVAKSVLLSLVFLLRFQALRYCGAAASILAELSGALVSKSISEDARRSHRGRRIIGFGSLAVALVLLSHSWDRIGCFPLSSSSSPSEGCGRLMPILLPFLSGFLGFYERSSGNASPLRQLGKKRTRLATLAITTVMLFIPASISFFVTVGGKNENPVSASDMGWPLVNTVIFGVVLNENFSGDEKVVFSAKDINREFLVTLFCTLVWELVYLPNISLPGFMLCGLLLWIAVWELGSSSLHYVEIGSLVHSESLYSMIRNPIQHIMSEKKTRKIAFFLLINTTYMFVEFVAGFMSNSLGLISDACHMLFDCAALAIGLYASYISRLPANSQFNYGRGRFEVLSGYANAVFLVLVGAMIVLESMERILDPQEISTGSLLAVSIGGLLVNIIGLVFFHEEHHHAHGAGGSCTHPHIHSCSNSHSKWNSNANSHLISHSHSHATHVHDSNNEHSLDCHSHSNHHHHHHHHHEKQNDSCDHQKKGDRHSHCSIHKGDDHHCNHEEHYHHDNINHVGDHNHENSSKHNHEHENLLVGIKEEGSRHYHIDHNMEGIFLHVLADTLGSVGVVVSTLLIKYKGWLIADPACSIFISVMIISSVIPLLRNSAEILLHRIPRSLEQTLKEAIGDIMRIEGVHGVSSVHVWNFSNTEIVGTVHLHVSSEHDKDLIKKRALDLFQQAGVKDIIIQVECLR